MNDVPFLNMKTHWNGNDGPQISLNEKKCAFEFFVWSTQWLSSYRFSIDSKNHILLVEFVESPSSTMQNAVKLKRK